MELNVPSVEGRQKAWEAMIAEERALLLNKGADYTAGQKDVDAYANFRLVAELLAGAPSTSYTVALVYALKHVFSLITFAKTGKQESGEGLRGRHMDARNYFFILNELVPDHVNHFEDAQRESSEVARVNELLDSVAAMPFDADYPTVLTEDTGHYYDESDQSWHPIHDLDAREEVNANTTKNYGFDTAQRAISV